MTLNKTEWFDINIKPVHIGVYELSRNGDEHKDEDSGEWTYWNGKVFVGSWDTPKAAAWRGGPNHVYPHWDGPKHCTGCACDMRFWRGVTERRA